MDRTSGPRTRALDRQELSSPAAFRRASIAGIPYRASKQSPCHEGGCANGMTVAANDRMQRFATGMTFPAPLTSRQ